VTQPLSGGEREDWMTGINRTSKISSSICQNGRLSKVYLDHPLQGSGAVIVSALSTAIGF